MTETAEFSDSGTPVGWSAVDGGFLSPEYSNSVSRVALAYGPADGQFGEAQLFAIAHVNGAETQIASLNAATAEAAFDFPAASDYRQFRIVANGLLIARFSAMWLDTRIDAPANIVATALTTNSLEVSWNAVNGASGYRVSVWTNVVTGASEGTESWSDDFSRAAASSGSPGAIASATFNFAYADMEGWDCVYYVYPSTNSSAIRIGGADKGHGGVLVSPSLPAGTWHLRMRAWRYRNEDGTDMPIQRVSAGVTSLVSIVAFTREATVPEEFLIDLPTLNEGDRIIFCSFTNKTPRVILDKVALVAGYSAGVSSPIVVKEVSVADATSCTVNGLPESVPVVVGVSAIDWDGVPSERSAGVAVDLAHPPPRATLNACPVNGLAGNHVYSQNFDSLAEQTATSGNKDFYNGMTLPFWQAWQDSDPAETFAFYAGGNQTGAKFVALATNINESTRAFGARGRQGTTMTWGLAFTNDTDSAVILTNVSYSAQQWGFANTTNQLLSCEYLVTNRLEWIVSFSDDWQTCAETAAQVFAAGTYDMPEATAVECVSPAEIRIAPGEVLYLKWTLYPPAKGSSAIMAIDDLTVAFKVVGRGLFFKVATAQAHVNVP